MTDLIPTLAEPYVLFSAWFDIAAKQEINDPNAMSLATVNAAGRPAVRMVLLKSFDERGFVFYTNLTSRKGQELAAHAYAAIGFHWKSLRRQVRATGMIEQVTASEADAYFNPRPRGSQLGAHASLQSQPLASRDELQQRLAAITKQYAGRTVPRPDHWSGYRLLADEIEFWQEMPDRLHDRLRYTREGGNWTTQRLYP